MQKQKLIGTLESTEMRRSITDRLLTYDLSHDSIALLDVILKDISGLLVVEEIASIFPAFRVEISVAASAVVEKFGAGGSDAPVNVRTLFQQNAWNGVRRTDTQSPEPFMDFPGNLDILRSIAIERKNKIKTIEACTYGLDAVSCQRSRRMKTRQ